MNWTKSQDFMASHNFCLAGQHQFTPSPQSHIVIQARVVRTVVNQTADTVMTMTTRRTRIGAVLCNTKDVTYPCKSYHCLVRSVKGTVPLGGTVRSWHTLRK